MQAVDQVVALLTSSQNDPTISYNIMQLCQSLKVITNVLLLNSSIQFRSDLGVRSLLGAAIRRSVKPGLCGFPQ